MYPNRPRAQDEYLLQKISTASPEQLVALLLEGAQRFLAQAVQSIGRRDVAGRSRAINRASAIVEELMVRLNHEAGTEVVANLVRVYEWWSFEMFDASSKGDSSRLERVSTQMGNLKATWEQLHLQRAAAGGRSLAPGSEGMVG